MKRVGRHETVRWERDRKCDRFHRRVQGHMKNAGLLRKVWGWEMENRTVALKWKKVLQKRQLTAYMQGEQSQKTVWRRTTGFPTATF